MYSLTGKRIWVAGHGGMVGAALLRRLAFENCEVLVVPRDELDLTRQAHVETWMSKAQPNVVIVAAAKVGGILANQKMPGVFLRDNLLIAANIIHSAYLTGVERLVFVASSAVYPANAPQPLHESSLMCGAPDPSHDGYAAAKLAGMSLCRTYRNQYGSDFFTVIPSNLYGPRASYNSENSHVIPAMLRKFHEARLLNGNSVLVWGTGRPQREFLYSEDLADALVFLLKYYREGVPINVGSGQECSIKQLAESIAAVVGYDGQIKFDESKPDGAMRRCMDVSRLRALGWGGARPLSEGLVETYRDYQATLTQGSHQSRA